MPATRNTQKHAIPLLCGESGTSLLELIGAMVAGLVVLGATLQSLSYFQQEFAQQQDRSQTTLAVDDGRGWPDRKLVQICWNEQCQHYTLARAGQRNLLTLVEPIAYAIPAGASVSVMNRLRYYSRTDERGSLRLLRQIDGGASVLIGNIEGVTLSYWNEQGMRTTHPALVRRIIIEISLPNRAVRETREISLRT